jgi:dipeptidase E
MSEAVRRILGMGGGGFLMEPDNPLLDDYVLSLARRQPARLCFVPTASGDSSDVIVKFYRAFSGRAVLNDLCLIGTPQRPAQPPRSSMLERFVLEQDILYVGGGSALDLLALWRAHRLDRVLRAAWEQGVVLAGMSAGMICWFENSITTAFGAPAPLGDGLGFLKGSASPHFDASPSRRVGYRKLIAEGLAPGYGVDDSAALYFEGSELIEAVSSREDAHAYRVTADGDEEIPTRYLGTPRV